MKIKPLNTREMDWIEDTIRDNYGCDFDFSEYGVLENENNNKLYLVTKELRDIDLRDLEVNSIGIYFGRKKKERIRLSQEGCFLIEPLATRNVVELNKKQAENFMKKLGVKDEFDCENGAFVIVKWKDDVLGPGHYRDGNLKSLIPKHRRIQREIR